MKSNSLLGRSDESMDFECLEYCTLNSLKNHATGLSNRAVEDNIVGSVFTLRKISVVIPLSQ